jgi:hypothetical protein
MNRKRVISDPLACERLWKACIPAYSVSDLWEFRMCFQRHFHNHLSFLVLENSKGISGMLPLSHIQHLDTKSFFPGETWHDKTWIERTRIYAREPVIYEELFSLCQDRTFLRYMDISDGNSPDQIDLDEIGYVLYPALLDYDMANFRQRFSNKKFKSILKNINSIMEMGGRFHVNRLEDYDLLVKMSLEKFGEESYLCDDRFRESFRDVMNYLLDKGWLRMISLELEGEIAAVDLGAIYNRTYTVFLGGVFSGVPGIAKVMNMYHIDYALQNRLFKLDFLCGDFHWKKLWHLDQEPLYKLITPDLEEKAGIVTDFGNIYQSRNYEQQVTIRT